MRDDQRVLGRLGMHDLVYMGDKILITFIILNLKIHLKMFALLGGPKSRSM